MRIQDVLNHGRYILGHGVNELEKYSIYDIL